ncbi:MAG: TIGR04222 domain-containing membrane protein [Sphingomonadales bacterium]|nr:TIGR04222 domain-containing membrane protein [Sphingomonadales bacterium]
MDPEPLNLTGSLFVMLYLAVLACAWTAGLVLAAWLRPPGRRGRIQSEDDVAVLAGGGVRLAEAVTVRLLANRKLVQSGFKQFEAVDRTGGETPVERAILNIARPAGWKSLVMAAASEMSAIERRLAACGLLLDTAQLVKIRSIVVAPLVMAMGFGLTRLVTGLAGGHPVGVLIMLLIGTGLLIIWQFFRTARATQAGLAVLQEERDRHARLCRAPMSDEMGLAVALFGTAVLSGSALTAFHEMRQRSDAGSNTDSGCDGDSGGGGCGGCGGCGG